VEYTQYSNTRLRDCIIKENDLIDYAIELGHEVVAITDHECISNAIKVQKYYNKIKKNHPNFKVILGNEIYLCRNGLTKDNFIKGQDKFWHFILLAKDAIGHQQIREISTRAWYRSWMTGKMRRVPTYYQDIKEIIGANPGHVIGSTACLGSFLSSLVLQYESSDQKEEYLNQIRYWVEGMEKFFEKGNFFFELQPSASKEQTYVNQFLVSLSSEMNIPYIITTDSHYLTKKDRPIHKAYLNAQEGEREVDSFYATTYMMNTEELESYLDLNEEQLEIAYQNIRKIKDMCSDYDLQKPLRIPELTWKKPKNLVNPEQYYSQIPYLKAFINSDYNGDKILAQHIVDRLFWDETLQNQKTYEAVDECLKMTWESSLVNKTHWSAYYLNLQKIIDTVWDAGSLVGPGRGSGVGLKVRLN
jgi:DNA polymerase-3 subunit alpha